MSETPSLLSPSPAQESQCESVAAPAAAVQGRGTIFKSLRKFSNRYQVELIFAQLLSVAFNVFAAMFSLSKLFGVCA